LKLAGEAGTGSRQASPPPLCRDPAGSQPGAGHGLTSHVGRSACSGKAGIADLGPPSSSPSSLPPGCTTFQLSFPEECCPSSYTRVKPHHAGPGHGHERERPQGGRRRKAAPTLDPTTARRHGKRRLAWLAPAHLLDHLAHIHAEEDADVPPPSPTRTASSTALPQPNPARDALYAPLATAAPAADPGMESIYAVDDGGCHLAPVYRQVTCPAAEERILEESRQIMQLEMWKEEGGGKRVAVECGRVGTFWY